LTAWRNQRTVLRGAWACRMSSAAQLPNVEPTRVECSHGIHTEDGRPRATTCVRFGKFLRCKQHGSTSWPRNVPTPVNRIGAISCEQRTTCAFWFSRCHAEPRPCGSGGVPRRVRWRLSSPGAARSSALRVGDMDAGAGRRLLRSDLALRYVRGHSPTSRPPRMTVVFCL